MKTGDLLYLPATMVHGGKVGDSGCDVLDVFFPPRPDYKAKKQAREAGFPRRHPGRRRSPSSSWTGARAARA